MRDSMVFYRSFRNALSKLPDKDRLEAYDALVNYGLDDLADAEGVSAAILEAFKPLIDSNNRKYENGKKGGRPKKNQDETKEEPSGNQAETKANLNDKCKMLNANKRVISTKSRKPSYENQRVYDYDELEEQLRRHYG